MECVEGKELDQKYQDAPEKEPLRQQYFIEKGQELVAELTEKLHRQPTCHVTTFGCQMNARDSEKLVGILELMGYKEIDEETADMIIYNTCTVRENADNKVFGRLGILNGYKKQNPNMKIGICGCLIQENLSVEKIKKSYPFVDFMFGTHNIHELAELVVKNMESRKMVVDVWNKAHGIFENLPNKRRYRFKSGVNIMFGCNNFCTFCIVPSVRGREISREPKDIINEIKEMVDDGVVEIMLLGQNVNSYGKYFKEKYTFPDLLRDVDKIEGLKRIRFMTSHPKDLSDELIDVIANSKHICHHIHLPLQSGSSKVLKRMNRHYDRERYMYLINEIRKKIPDCAITTDIIVGFPGETEEDFEETLEVVKEVRYDSAFTFQYSMRSGTPAAKFEQVPKDIVTERFDRLLPLVQKIGREKTKELEGKVVKVLAEDVNKEDSSLLTGRLENNSVVHFKADISDIGRILNVKLDKALGFYYMGTVVD